jgi:sugar lactone lactonase YvrE
MIRQLKAELLSDVGALLGEGPTWDARTSELLSVDILNGTVFVHDEGGTRLATFWIEGHIGSILPAHDGGWLVVGADGFSYLRRDGSVLPLLAVEADRPDLRFNDAKCDPWGQALAGTMRYDQAPGSGTLYRLEPEGDPAPGGEPPLAARVLLEGVGLSNGLTWNEDGDTMFYIDSLARTVVSFVYAPDLPSLGTPRERVLVKPGVGTPDGMSVDAEGNLWVALFGGGAVHCYRPDGELRTVVSLPVPEVTSVAFGGAQGDRLFITTAGGNGEPGGDGAGGIWTVDPGVTGPPATPWHRPTAAPPPA